MDTVKKFAKYALWLILFFVIVRVCSYVFIAKSYIKLDNYEILVNTPKIEILESKSTNVNGYIVGNVTNNSDSKIEKKYIRINFYGKDNNYIGTEYAEIKNLAKDGKAKFHTIYKLNNVTKFYVDITDEKVEQKDFKWNKIYTYTSNPDNALFIAWSSVIFVLFLNIFL